MCIVIDKLIGDISTVMYSYVLIILLLATGLYFTFRTRFVQFRMFLESIRVVGEKPEKAGATSSFQALMVSTASRVGTGNIIGISTAICAGGFGAVFWMWVIAIIGGASAYGGSGTVPGIVVGAILLGVINQGMSIYGLDNNWQYVVKGAVLLIAVIFDVVSNHKTGKA